MPKQNCLSIYFSILGRSLIAHFNNYVHGLRGNDTSTLRTGVVAGALCTKETMKQMISKDKLGASEIINVYGQPEASPGITGTKPTDPFEMTHVEFRPDLTAF